MNIEIQEDLQDSIHTFEKLGLRLQWVIFRNNLYKIPQPIFRNGN